MSQIVLAVYEQGLLHPLESLPLKEHQKVRIQILPESNTNREEKRLNTWVKMGLVTPPLPISIPNAVSDSRRYELADRFGKAVEKPLSETIIEERGDL